MQYGHHLARAPAPSRRQCCGPAKAAGRGFSPGLPVHRGRRPHRRRCASHRCRARRAGYNRHPRRPSPSGGCAGYRQAGQRRPPLSTSTVSLFSTVLSAALSTLATRSTAAAGTMNVCPPALTRTPLKVDRVRGSTILNVVPPAVSLATVTVPPSFSTFSRTMARPSPLPEISVIMGLVDNPELKISSSRSSRPIRSASSCVTTPRCTAAAVSRAVSIPAPSSATRISIRPESMRETVHGDLPALRLVPPVSLPGLFDAVIDTVAHQMDERVLQSLPGPVCRFRQPPLTAPVPHPCPGPAPGPGPFSAGLPGWSHRGASAPLSCLRGGCPPCRQGRTGRFPRRRPVRRSCSAPI